MSIRFALALLLALPFFASTAAAQGRVSIEELTVDGDPPPDMYRAMLIEGIRPSVEEIGTAYGRRLAERPGLHGDYRMRLWVSNREVVRITPETSIGDETMERLTREAIYRFRLPDAAPTGGAWVRFIVRFTAPTSGVGAAGTAPVTAPVTASATGTGSTGSGSTGSGSTGGAGAGTITTGTTPSLPIPSARTPSLEFARITGVLTEAQVTAMLPLSAFGACVTSTRAGTVRFTVSINRRGRVTATRTGGTFNHSRSTTCMDRAIEALTPGAEAGPTVARIVLTVPAP